MDTCTHNFCIISDYKFLTHISLKSFFSLLKTCQIKPISHFFSSCVMVFEFLISDYYRRRWRVLSHLYVERSFARIFRSNPGRNLTECLKHNVVRRVLNIESARYNQIGADHSQSRHNSLGCFIVVASALDLTLFSILSY